MGWLLCILSFSAVPYGLGTLSSSDPMACPQMRCWSWLQLPPLQQQLLRPFLRSSTHPKASFNSCCALLPHACPSHSQTFNLCSAVLDVELSRAADASVKGLFVAPTGSHTLCMVQVETTTEVHYIHSRWKKAKVLGKLKGVHITAVAWNKQQGSEGNTGCGFESCQGACQNLLDAFLRRHPCAIVCCSPC